MSTITEPKTWKGASALEPFLVPIDELQETEGNPRIGDVDEIMLSLERFGQVRPIAVRDDGHTIVAGHHVTKAAKRLGWTHVACIPGNFSDEGEAIAYLLADNRLADLGSLSAEAFVQMAMPLADSGKLEGTGISMDFYEDQLALTAGVDSAAEEVLATTFERAESDEDAAERGAMIAAYQQKREVVMLMGLDEYEHFGSRLRIIRQEAGTDGVKDSVMAAVDFFAYHLNQGGPTDSVPGEPDHEDQSSDEPDAGDGPLGGA